MSDVLPLHDDCWNRIGVRGDRSCPQLKAVIHCRNCQVFIAASQVFFDRPRQADYESELTAQIAGVAKTSSQGSLSVLIFSIGDEAFALETSFFVEVTEERAVHRVPHRTSHVFAGMVNMHGQLELCAALEGLLDTDAATSRPDDRRQARMVMIEDRQGRRWVFKASAVHGVQPVLRVELGSAPSTLARRTQHFVSGVFEHEGRHVALLDADALFDALERSVR